jgi:hypothetical protein
VAINLLKSVQAIVRQIPDLQAVTLKHRSSGDTYYPDVSYPSARCQPRQQTSGLAGDGAPVEHCRIWLFQDASQLLTAPDVDDTIVDALGVSWLVQAVEKRWYDSTVTGHRILVCDCGRFV